MLRSKAVHGSVLERLVDFYLQEHVEAHSSVLLEQVVHELGHGHGHWIKMSVRVSSLGL